MTTKILVTQKTARVISANRGLTGPTGADSTVTGPTGATGATGAVSTAVGPTGSTGATGAVSTAVGPTGNTGAAGAASTAVGPTGSVGATGAASTAVGPTGNTGAAGAASTAVGPTGSTGAAGAASTAVGPTGPTGPSVHVATTDPTAHTQYALLAGRDTDILIIDQIRAFDAAGLKLYDDDGYGFLINDAGDTLLTCPAEKTFLLGVSVYDDIYLSISVTKPGGTAPTWAPFHGNLKQYTFAIDDYVEGSFELKHDYKEGTDLNIHCHIVTNGAEASKEARYSFEYWMADMGEASVTTATLTSADKALTNADGHHEYIDIGDISGTGVAIGAMVGFLFKRVALADGTGPTADPFVLSVGCHYQIDTLGSRTETSK